MADRKEARKAIADDVRALADDLRSLLEDPAERKRKEIRWRMLYGAVALGFTLVSRRLVTRGWAILTGEQPPMKGHGAPPAQREQTPTASR